MFALFTTLICDGNQGKFRKSSKRQETKYLKRLHEFQLYLFMKKGSNVNIHYFQHALSQITLFLNKVQVP